MKKQYLAGALIAEDSLLYLLTVISVIFFSLHFIPWLQVDLWRHDSLYYVDSYANKFVSEGRWINFILFPVLKCIPAAVASSLCYIGLIAFVYVSGRRLGLLAPYAVLMAVLIANIPLFRIQMEWPATLVTSYLILWVAAWVADRLPDYLFFPLFSVLFFGAVSSFYFLLPFLFVRNLRFSGAFGLLVVWGLSFPFGYLVSNILVYLAVGHGVEIAEWRNPNPVNGWADVTENTLRVWEGAKAHYAALVEYSTLVLLAFSAFVVWLVRLRTGGLWSVGVAVCCSLALYVTTIPAGIVISARTAGVAWAAVFLGMFLIDRPSRVQQFVLAVPLLLLSASLALSTAEYTRWYRAVTGGLVDNADSLVAQLPSAKQVVIVATEADWQAAIEDIQRRTNTAPFLTERMSSPLYWRALLLSRGYAQVILCPEQNESWDCVWAREHLEVRQAGLMRSGYFGALRSGDGRVIWVSSSYM